LWRKTNPDKARASNAKSKAKNPEKYLATKAAWRKRNPEKYNAYKRSWRLRNMKRVLAWNEAWRASNADKYREIQVRNMLHIPVALKDHIPPELIQAKIMQLKIKRELKARKAA
jgi:hypothetical protein